MRKLETLGFQFWTNGERIWPVCFSWCQAIQKNTRGLSKGKSKIQGWYLESVPKVTKSLLHFSGWIDQPVVQITACLQHKWTRPFIFSRAGLGQETLLSQFHQTATLQKLRAGWESRIILSSTPPFPIPSLHFPPFPPPMQGNGCALM